MDASNSPHYKQVGAATKALGHFKDVVAASAAIPNQTGKVWIVSVTPASGPSTTATKNLVANIRTQGAKIQSSTTSTSS